LGGSATNRSNGQTSPWEWHLDVYYLGRLRGAGARSASFVGRAHGLELAFPPEHRHEIKPFTALLGEMVLSLDPPRHTQVRKQLNRAFTPEVLARNRARIAELFDQLLDDWIRRREGEIMETLVHPFPALVIADWMGLPPHDWPRFMMWADALFHLMHLSVTAIDMETVREWLALVEENRTYLEAVVESRRPGGSDLFGLLMEMEEGEVVDRAQLVAQAMLIMLAGHETTRNLIGSGLHWLVSTPVTIASLLAMISPSGWPWMSSCV
jgi:cytochrome P450